MNKFELSREIFKEVCIKNCNSVEEIFTQIEEFEESLIENGYIKLSHCPRCNCKIEFIDLQGDYRAKCECIKVQGKNEVDAYNLFIEKLREV